MIVTVKKEIEEQVEITFPAYFKNIAHDVKVMEGGKAIWITNKQEIGTAYYGLSAILENTQHQYAPSTPEEFNAALEAAINHINELNK